MFDDSMFDNIDELDEFEGMVEEVTSKDAEELTAQIQGLDLSKNVTDDELTLVINLSNHDTGDIDVRADSKAVLIYLPYEDNADALVEPDYDKPDLSISLEQPINVNQTEATLENDVLLVEAPLQDRVGTSLLNRNNTTEIDIN